MPNKGTLTRERILATAVGLIHQRGIGATSINDLQAATGMTKGSLYFHFKSKDAVTLAALEKARMDFLSFLDSALTGKTPGDRLDAFFRKVVEKHRALGFTGG
jgi:TetR/AcrR family transcriptional regulator, transcriptional repressor for nem operon